MCSSSELMRTYTKTDKNLVIVRLPCTGNNFRQQNKVMFSLWWPGVRKKTNRLKENKLDKPFKITLII